MKLEVFIIGGLMLLASCTNHEKSTLSEELNDGVEELSERIDELTESRGKTAFNEVKVNDLYSLDIAEYMSETASLNADASLQYLNISEEKYLLVIDEDKQDFIDIYKEIEGYDNGKSVLENYADVQFQFFSESVTFIEQKPMKDKEVNNVKMKVKLADANVLGIPAAVSYWLGYIEGKDRLYTVMAWTMREQKNNFNTDALEMILSFKELQ